MGTKYIGLGLTIRLCPLSYKGRGVAGKRLPLSHKKMSATIDATDIREEPFLQATLGPKSLFEESCYIFFDLMKQTIAYCRITVF